MRARLGAYHDDPDSAFWGWNRIWLAPEFRSWTIEKEIESIACPLLALQGMRDEYGTMKQIEGIALAVPHAELIELPACGHSPQRDQPEQLIAAVTRFMQKHNPGDKP